MDFVVEFVSQNLVTQSNFEIVRISRFSRHWVSSDTWHDHVDATWQEPCGALV